MSAARGVVSGVVVALVACGGSEPPIATPQARPTVQLVRCAPAVPPPLSTSEGHLFGAVHRRSEVPEMVGLRGELVRVRSVAVTIGMPSASGGIDHEVIRGVVTQNLTGIRACYQAQLGGYDAHYRSSIVWRFAVTQAGTVLWSRASSSLVDVTLQSCVASAFRGMRFPARSTGGTLTVTIPIVAELDASMEPPEDEAAAVDTDAPWTPYALDTEPPTVDGDAAARAVEGALRHRLAKLEPCFGADARGSARVMVELDPERIVSTVRVGGLGHHATERCIAGHVARMQVPLAPPRAHEVACDLSRGNARPWRVTPAAGYGVISIAGAQLRYGDEVLAPDDEPEALVDSDVYLIVSEPTTPGSTLARALAWANEGDAAVIALRDGPAAPLYIGLGRVAISEGEDGLGSGVVQPVLQVDRTRVTACDGHNARSAKLSRPDDVASLVRRLAKRCRQLRCSSSLAVTFDGDAIVRDLVEVTSAARRAGFERVLIGGDEECEPS